MAICRSLAGLMGGKLELQSEAGRGSTFRFTVRLALAQERAAPSGRAPGRILPSSKSLRILLAEDNPVNQKVAGRLLERMGHRVDIAPDGEQAVAAAMRGAYDLVLMDCQMPRMDGYTAARAIRQAGPAAGPADPGRSVPIAAMTANATPEARRRCLDAGMDYFLSKPVAPALLYDLIEKIVAAIPPADAPCHPGIAPAELPLCQ